MSSRQSGQSSGLSWSTEPQEGLITIRLQGELDLSSAPVLERVLAEAIAGSPVTVIDLAELEFMDSTGLRLFAQIQRSAGESDARFLLGRPSPAVLRVLQVAGLIDHFSYAEGAPPSERVCPVCDEWVASLGSECPHCGSTF